jgi:hypothetical protein
MPLGIMLTEGFAALLEKNGIIYWGRVMMHVNNAHLVDGRQYLYAIV